MTTRVAVSGLGIEYSPNSTEVLLRLGCDSSYEAAVLYESLTSAADSGDIKLDFEVVSKKC